MSKVGPIVIVDDDEDDQAILREVFEGPLKITNPLKFFSDGNKVLEYLRTTKEQPFIIFCDVNMPIMNGLELRNIIHEDDYLRRKSIPFIFLSTGVSHQDLQRAYELNVQGFFIKGSSIQSLEKIIRITFDYWQMCRHPNQ
jgi:CheY-like chemotaxis protein